MPGNRDPRLHVGENYSITLISKNTNFQLFISKRTFNYQ